MGIKTIRVKEEAHKELTDLAKAHGMNIGEFTEEMVNYFKRTKSDPRQKEDTVTTLKQVKKELNRLIAFIKKNEESHLKPILDSMEITRRNLSDNVEKLNDITIIRSNIDAIKKDITHIYGNTKNNSDNWKTTVAKFKNVVDNQIIIDENIKKEGKKILAKNDKINDRFDALKKILVWIREFEEGFDKSMMGGIVGYKKEDMNAKLSSLKKIVEEL
jgi:gas vesicle protein